MSTEGQQFQEGDRVFSHYVMDWGTVERVGRTTEPTTHGVTGSPLPGSTWYSVRFDKSGSMELLDDAHGNWDLARIVPPEIATRYGYGSDPKAVKA
jgi:hypothetical protein